MRRDFIVEEVLGSPLPVTTGGRAGRRRDRPRARRRARRAGEPLQYVLGHWAFRSLDLLVDQRVLIPRPETEQVVEVALGEIGRLATRSGTVVDAGTGSGAIALSLATKLALAARGRAFWGTDASPEALAVAPHANRDRVRRQGDAPVLPVHFVQGNWLDPLPSRLRGAVDVVVSNPPYVAARGVAGPPRRGASASRSPRWSRARGPTARPGSAMWRLCCPRPGTGWRAPVRS